LSNAGEGAAELMLAVAYYCCRVMLAMTLPCYTGDGVTEATLAVA
jgi:hypothetical protein